MRKIIKGDRLEKRLKESRADKTVENGITFDFYGPSSKLREDGLWKKLSLVM